MDNDLERCPFCGGEPVLKGYEEIEYFVQCEICGMSSMLSEDKEMVIRFWNRRPGKNENTILTDHEFSILKAAIIEARRNYNGLQKIYRSHVGRDFV